MGTQGTHLCHRKCQPSRSYDIDLAQHVASLVSFEMRQAGNNGGDQTGLVASLALERVR